MEIFDGLIRRKAVLTYPVLPAPPTAVLVPWFRSQGAIRVFAQGWGAEAEAHRPAAIAATWPQLEALLPLKIESLTHAVIVLARPGDVLLTVEQRQSLWRAFRVPVFEQIIGEGGLLLAAECEAHAGLHIESPKLDLDDRPMERAACGCGRTTPRLRDLALIEELRSAAAYAR